MHKQYYIEQKKVEKLISRRNQKADFITEFMIVTSIRYLQESLHRYTGDMI